MPVVLSWVPEPLELRWGNKKKKKKSSKWLRQCSQHKRSERSRVRLSRTLKQECGTWGRRVSLIPQRGRHHTTELSPTQRWGPGLCTTTSVAIRWDLSRVVGGGASWARRSLIGWGLFSSVGAAVDCYQTTGIVARGGPAVCKEGSGGTLRDSVTLTLVSVWQRLRSFPLTVSFKLASNSRAEVLRLSPLYR